jgi:hypothetical protein
MAKRAVRRERRAIAATPSPSVPPPPAPKPWRTTTFWLSGAACGLVVAALAALALVGVLVSGSDDDAVPEASASPSASEQEAALRKQFKERDREQVKELTALAFRTADGAAPLLTGLAKTLPPGTERVGAIAPIRDVKRWQATARKLAKPFADPPSGETATNVARMGLAATVDALIEATQTYGLAVRNHSTRRALLQRAREQRDLAARVWSIGATQLDAINHWAGNGHQHVVLAATGEPNQFGDDSAPMGSAPSGE